MKKTRIKRILRIGLLIGFIFILSQVNYQEILYYLGQIRGKIIIRIGLLQFLTMLLLGFQWYIISRSLGSKGKFIELFMINNWGNIVDAITPGAKIGGEITRFSLLKNRLKIDNSQSLIIVALQKLVSISSFYLLTLVSLIYLWGDIKNQDARILKLIILSFIVFALFFFFIFLLTFNKRLREKILGRFTRGKVRERLVNFQRNLQVALDQYRKRKILLFGLFILTIIIWALYGFKMYILIRELKLKIGFFQILAITNIAYMVGMIPLLPGSVGSFEGILLVLFSMLGIDLEIGLSVSIIFRLLTFWLEFILSGLFIGLEKIKLLLGKRLE